MSFCSEVKNIYCCPDTGFIEYFYVDDIPAYYAEELDKYIVLLRHHETKEIIGIQMQPRSIKALEKKAKKETKEINKQDKEIQRELWEIFK